MLGDMGYTDKLQKLCALRGLDQSELAGQVGLSKSSMSRCPGRAISTWKVTPHSRTALIACAGIYSVDSPDARRRSARRARWLQEVVLPVATIVVLVVLWEIACRVFVIPAYLVPTPTAIWKEVSELPGPVFDHTMATTYTVLLGFAVSVLVSLPLAVLLTSSPLVSNAVYPLLVLTQSSEQLGELKISGDIVRMISQQASDEESRATR